MKEFSFRVELLPVKFDLGVFKYEVNTNDFISFIYLSFHDLNFDDTSINNSIYKEFLKWLFDPMIEIKCTDDNAIACPLFAVHKQEFIIEFDPELNMFKLTNNGIQVALLDPQLNYTFSLKLRGFEPQRKDLITNWDGVTEIDCIFLAHNSITYPFKKSNYCIDSLFEKLIEIGKYYQICISIDNIEIPLSFDCLKENKLVSLDQVEYEIKNHMVFSYNHYASNDPCESLVSSFDNRMGGRNGNSEIERLSDYISWANSNVDLYFDRSFPFVNVIQSSGSGKSKIATEIMKSRPSAYIALKRTTGKYSYPSPSTLSNLFFLKVADKFKSAHAVVESSVITHYLLLLKALLKDTLDKLKSIESNPNPFEVMAKLFIEGEFIGRELELVDQYNLGESFELYLEPKTFNLKSKNDPTLALENRKSANDQYYLLEAFHSHLRELHVLESYKEQPKLPFIFIIDDASLLEEVILDDMKISLFRLFRSAIKLIDLKFHFIVVTLGTNTNIVKLNPEFKSEYIHNYGFFKLFDPFIINQIWDISFDFNEFIKNPIGYTSLRCGKMLTFLYSLGRPLWSSLDPQSVSHAAKLKITNEYLKSGEAYLAFWMIRIGLLINPKSSVNSLLINSLMGTLIYSSPTLDHMRVYYPSEPALAIAARNVLDSSVSVVEDYYMNLEKFILKCIIDPERVDKIISMDVSLRSIAKAKKVAINWEHSSKLLSAAQVTKTSSQNNPDFDDRNDNYRIVTVEAFLVSMYGQDVYEKIKQFIPDRIKSGLINATHFIQVHHDLPKDFPSCHINLSSSNVLTWEVLAAAISRGAGISFSPNYVGLDYVIPVVLKPINVESLLLKKRNNSEITNEPDQDDYDNDNEEFIVNDEDFEEKPEYTFIGVKVNKDLPEHVENVIAKGALSNHIIRCGCHSESTCTCSYKLPSEYYNNMIENALILVHSMCGNSEDDCVDKTCLEFKCESKLETLPDYCGTQFNNTINNFKQELNDIVSPSCLLQPDVWISGKIKNNLELHVMFKQDSTGIIEKLTAIHSTDLSVFDHSNLMSKEVGKIASRIVSGEKSIFDEIGSLDHDYNNLEITASIESRNSLTSNRLRELYDLSLDEQTE